MRIKRSPEEWRFAELVEIVPLEPIEDDRAYMRAMQLLDQLFLLDRTQNYDECVYFQALAQIVYEYESRGATQTVQPATLDRVDHLDHRLQGECLQSEQHSRHTQWGAS
jgi:antitoxin component HigA of HigAB toxin-antitoxin module